MENGLGGLACNDSDLEIRANGGFGGGGGACFGGGGGGGYSGIIFNSLLIEKWSKL